ncbi:MAG: hypothetical protein QMD14_03910 [Candidatus Aenigmarchaeota archaeon]|nr:hypothetical protein [Candidatus Aenigmarchaeota archaeon]
MKIPLWIRLEYNKLMAFVLVSFELIRYHAIPKPLLTLVDTGSPWTTITPFGVAELQLPVKAFKVADNYPIVLFGGHKFRRLIIPRVKVRMRNEKDEPLCFESSSISVLQPTAKILPEEFHRVPAILGNDFLEEHKLCMQLNLVDCMRKTIFGL